MKIPKSLTSETLEDTYSVIAERWKERKSKEIPKMKKEEGYEE